MSRSYTPARYVSLALLSVCLGAFASGGGWLLGNPAWAHGGGGAGGAGAGGAGAGGAGGGGASGAGGAGAGAAGSGAAGGVGVGHGHGPGLGQGQGLGQSVGPTAVATPRPHFSVPESRRLTHHETHSNAHRVAFSSRYGHRHQPNISAALRALNAAHASPVALAHASPRSIVGKLAEYDRAMQLALAMPQNTPAEIAARDQAIANARLMLADQTDRTITPQVISRVDYLLGLPPSNPMLGTSLAPTPVAPAPPRGEVIASPLPPPHAPRAEDPPRANDPPVPSPVQVIAAPAPPDDAPRLAAPPAPPAPPSPPQPAMPPPPPSPPELFN